MPCGFDLIQLYLHHSQVEVSHVVLRVFPDGGFKQRAALVPALKAALGTPQFDEVPADAVKAFLTGFDPTEELLATLPDQAVQASDPTGESAVKAGKVLASSKEERLRNAIALLLGELDAIVAKELPDTEEVVT